MHVIPRAIDTAMGRGTFRVFGDDYPTPDGTCLRDYVHVNDLASAHLLALDALRAGAPSNAYNLGNGRPTSVRDVMASVERVTGKAVPHDVAPRREGDPAALYASSERVKPRARLAAAIRGSRRHRRDRLALARGAPAGLRDGDALMSRLKGQLADPLLSVVMPAYNEEATIEEIIRRVLAVPLRIELIIVDDGSKDNTREILHRLAGNCRSR